MILSEKWEQMGNFFILTKGKHFFVNKNCIFNWNVSDTRHLRPRCIAHWFDTSEHVIWLPTGVVSVSTSLHQSCRCLFKCLFKNFWLTGNCGMQDLSSLLLLLSRFSRVRLCATPQSTAHQAPPSLGFSRQEHWSGLPFPSPLSSVTRNQTQAVCIGSGLQPLDHQGSLSFFFFFVVGISKI